MDFKDMAGAYAALFTPFTPENCINFEMIERMVEHHLSGGLRGFFVGGTTGEGLLLTMEERKALLESVIKANNGRGKVISHVGCVRTEDSVDLARHAADVGADWVSSTAPVFYGQSFEGTLYHYRAIAEASDLPFMVYAFRTEIDPERDVELFKIKNLRGMKFTNSNFFNVEQLQRKLDQPALFLSGMDELFLPALSSGCFHGGIGTTYNFLPRHFSEIYRLLTEQNDVASARPLQQEVNKVIHTMLRHGNLLSYAKAIMRYTGFDCGICRGPNPPISEAEYEGLVKELDGLGVI